MENSEANVNLFSIGKGSSSILQGRKMFLNVKIMGTENLFLPKEVEYDKM